MSNIYSLDYYRELKKQREKRLSQKLEDKIQELEDGMQKLVPLVTMQHGVIEDLDRRVKYLEQKLIDFVLSTQK